MKTNSGHPPSDFEKALIPILKSRPFEVAALVTAVSYFGALAFSFGGWGIVVGTIIMSTGVVLRILQCRLFGYAFDVDLHVPFSGRSLSGWRMKTTALFYVLSFVLVAAALVLFIGIFHQAVRASDLGWKLDSFWAHAKLALVGFAMSWVLGWMVRGAVFFDDGAANEAAKSNHAPLTAPQILWFALR